MNHGTEVSIFRNINSCAHDRGRRIWVAVEESGGREALPFNDSSGGVGGRIREVDSHSTSRTQQIWSPPKKEESPDQVEGYTSFS